MPGQNPSQHCLYVGSCSKTQHTALHGAGEAISALLVNTGQFTRIPQAAHHLISSYCLHSGAETWCLRAKTREQLLPSSASLSHTPKKHPHAIPSIVRAVPAPVTSEMATVFPKNSYQHTYSPLLQSTGHTPGNAWLQQDLCSLTRWQMTGLVLT